MNRYQIVTNQNYPGINPVQFGHQNCTPRWSFGPAVREFWLLHYVVSGSGYFVRDGIKHNVTAGEIFVIPPYLETYYEADQKNPWHYIWIGFKADFSLPDAFSKPIIKSHGAGDIFKGMLRCVNMKGGKSAYLNSRIWELIALILESGDNEPDYIKKAVSLMQSEYMNNISVSGIAEQLNLDRSYFTTLFRRKVGVPPGQYLMNLRLEKAAELMAVYGESPSTASLSVGYTDLHHFSKAFKQKFGCSPRAYQNKFKAD